MIKEKKILLNYIFYIILGIIICMVGISGVFAETTTQTFSTFNTTAESLSNSIQCNNDVCVVYGVNHYNYDMNFEWGSNNSKTCINQATVSGTLSLNKDNFGMINQDFGYSNVYIVDNNIAHNCNYQVKDTYTTYTCTIDTLSTNFKIGYSLTGVGGQYSYNSIIYRNIDITCDTSTTQIIENNNQNTQNVINNNNSNTQNIINNQNQNTQDMIDSNMVCSSYGNESIVSDNGYLKSDGGIQYSTTGGISDYIRLSKNSKISVIKGRNSSSAHYCFYDNSKTKISCYANSTLVPGDYLTIPNNAEYVRFSFAKGVNEPQFNVCINGNQANNETSKGILGKLKDLFDTLFSNDDADISGLDNMVGWLPPGPVDSIINLPLAFFNALTNTLTGTCQSVSIPIPFVNQTLTLPCFDSFMSQYLTGFNTLWTLVGTILSVFILYYYLLSLYKWVDDTLTFRENNLPGYYGDNWGGGA